MVLGPRVKIIILNISPESKRSELHEVFPEDSFHVSRVNLQGACSKLKYFSCNSKKGDRARGPLIRECGPWSANHVNGTESSCESQ